MQVTHTHTDITECCAEAHAEMHRGRRAKLQKSAVELNSTGTSDTLEIVWLSERGREEKMREEERRERESAEGLSPWLDLEACTGV